MAIPVYASVPFLGTPAIVLTTVAAPMADNAYTTQGECTAWTNTDDVTMATVRFSGTFTIAPAIGSTVQVHMRKININGTAAEPQPTDNWLGGFRHSIPLNAGSTIQDIERVISIPIAGKTSQEWEVYFKLVGAGTTLVTGSTLTLTPSAYGPKG